MSLASGESIRSRFCHSKLVVHHGHHDWSTMGAKTTQAKTIRLNSGTTFRSAMKERIFFSLGLLRQWYTNLELLGNNFSRNGKSIFKSKANTRERCLEFFIHLDHTVFNAKKRKKLYLNISVSQYFLFWFKCV